MYLCLVENPNASEKYSHVRIRYHVFIDNEKGLPLLDDDTWLLLQAIDSLGSLVKAAEERKISYRKAWGDLKRSETFLGFSLIEKQRGGALGGETHLTDDGKEFVEAYRDFLGEVAEAVQPAIIRFKRRIKGKGNL